MLTPLQRIRIGASILGGVAVFSVCGYSLLADRPLLDALYWFVITVSSVGYTEKSELPPSLQVFTIVVIAVGMSAAAYTIGGLIQMLTEGEIERAIGRHRATRGIEQLSGHVIICGYGRIGHILAEDLERRKVKFVVVDVDPDSVADAEIHSYLVVRGNATEESTLMAAGVQRAKTLISALNSDADNVFLTLTSRNLAPGLTIIARGEHPKSEKKLIQAGADRVVLPAVIGARRIATMVTRPHAAEVMDQLTDHKILDVDLEELSLLPDGPLIGRTVRDAEAHIKHRLLVVAVRKHGGKTIFNPDPDYVFEAHDMMIVMGRPEDIQRFRATYSI